MSASEQYVKEFPPEREYETFLQAKAPVSPKSGIEASKIHSSLTPFHAAIVAWSVRYSLGQLIRMTPQPHESRQTAWSRKQRASRTCWCGKSTNGKSLCAEHLKVHRDRMRERRAA